MKICGQLPLWASSCFYLIVVGGGKGEIKHELQKKTALCLRYLIVRCIKRSYLSFSFQISGQTNKWPAKDKKYNLIRFFF